MSKPFPPDQPLVHLPPDRQVQQFADLYRATVSPATLLSLETLAADLGLQFTPDELLVLAALDSPSQVQEFLNTQIYYNNDHASVELDETAFSPRQVLQRGVAHCFEGALFAYAVNFLHGHHPRLVLLEACQDFEHNLVLFQDARTGLYGCNAHSRWQHLDGRPAQFATIRALAESYQPYYYSDWTNDPNDLTLVGYSDPFDLIAKFGVAWIAAPEMVWDIYYLYVDAAVRFHYLCDDSDATHPYQLVRALRENWIRIDPPGKSRVSVEDLPARAQELWRAFWNTFERAQVRPRGAAKQIEQEFMLLTGTTPIDLQDNADDLVYFLERGYRAEQLINP